MTDDTGVTGDRLDTLLDALATSNRIGRANWHAIRSLTTALIFTAIIIIGLYVVKGPLR